MKNRLFHDTCGQKRPFVRLNEKEKAFLEAYLLRYPDLHPNPDVEVNTDYIGSGGKKALRAMMLLDPEKDKDDSKDLGLRFERLFVYRICDILQVSGRPYWPAWRARRMREQSLQ